MPTYLLHIRVDQGNNVISNRNKIYDNFTLRKLYSSNLP